MTSFPMRRSDGSFDLHIVFEGLQADSTGLERWLATWFEKNATWKRVWIGGGKEETEVLSFLEEFIAPPSLENSGKGEISVHRAILADVVKSLKDLAKKIPGLRPGET